MTYYEDTEDHTLYEVNDKGLITKCHKCPDWCSQCNPVDPDCDMVGEHWEWRVRELTEEEFFVKAL